jgi:hypothetical protein
MWGNGGIAPVSLNFKAKMDISGQHSLAAEHRADEYTVIVVVKKETISPARNRKAAVQSVA